MTLEEKDAYLALFKRYKTYRYGNRLLNIEIEVRGRTVSRLENTLLMILYQVIFFFFVNSLLIYLF